MISVQEAFEIFRQRLELSETEQKDAERRHKSVRECIRGGFDIENDFLTGSYRRHTKTKSLKDVDIFFCIGPKEKHWRDKHPEEILKAFERRLGGEYGSDCVELGRRCVTVEFEKRNPTADKEGTVISNDAVPAYARSDHYEIPDRILGRWIKTNPDIHKEESTAKNKELGGKWVPLVKMLKRWNRSAGKPIAPSFLIEVMAQQLIDPPFTNYPSEVRRFFAASLDGIMRDWPDPAGFGPPVSDQMTPQKRQAAVEALRQAEVKAARAVRLEQQGKNGEALSLWREIMGKYFPTS
jgi:Second Messenger Oligonucleotide or Dinucleotide Synthetase domain